MVDKLAEFDRGDELDLEKNPAVPSQTHPNGESTEKSGDPSELSVRV
jgi:hypothetical protein